MVVCDGDDSGVDDGNCVNENDGEKDVAMATKNMAIGDAAVRKL